MQELRLVAVSEDGRSLVLIDAGAGGIEYQLPLDDALRAAVRHDRARLGQLQIELESQLRPREIQARIRAGETAEEVAAAAGVPVEKVRRYEGPVLGEREHVAFQARSATVRRSGTAEGPAPRLGELIASRLEPGGVDLDVVGWDAWRRDDGRWLVRVTYPLGKRQRAALWLYDPSRRVALPADDDAQAFVEGRRPGEPVQSEPAGASPGGRGTDGVGDSRREGVQASGRDDPRSRRLTSVPGGAAAERRNGRGDRDDRADAAGSGEVAPREAGSTSTDRGVSGSDRGVSDRDAAEDSAINCGASDRTTTDPTATDRPASDGPSGAGLVPASGDVPAGSGGPDRDPEPAEPPASPRHAADPQGRKAARGGRRASVPSWDDIVFGTRKQD